jgi:hypothetical protein
MRDVRHIPSIGKKRLLLNRARARLRRAREHCDQIVHEVVDVLDAD